MIAGAIALMLAAAPASPQTELARALDGRTAGPPVRCLQLSRVLSTRIVERTGLLYDVGGTLYLNRPRSGARNLRDDDILKYEVFAGQLCRGEPVQRLDRSTGSQYGFVLLGDFVPYRRPPKP